MPQRRVACGNGTCAVRRATMQRVRWSGRGDLATAGVPSSRHAGVRELVLHDGLPPRAPAPSAERLRNLFPRDAATSSAISGAPTPVSASRSDRRPRANRIRAIRSVDDATCSKQMRRCGNVERSQRPVDAGVGELVSTAPDTLDRLSRGDGRQPPSRRRDARPAGAPHRIADAWTCLRRTRATGERASRRWAHSGAELA